MRISYQAKRGIVKVPFAVSSVDISAAVVDGSFNSASVDLSGLVDGNYVEVAGFSAAALNGWHLVSGASVANKITTSSVLVDEAVGASVTIQGYEHGYGTSYALEQIHTGDARFELGVIKEQVRARTGYAETLLKRIDKTWTVTTDWIAQADIVYWSEWIMSVAAGEFFTVDPYGTAAAPDNPVLVELLKSNFPFARVGTLSEFKLSFTVREI